MLRWLYNWSDQEFLMWMGAASSIRSPPPHVLGNRDWLCDVKINSLNHTITSTPASSGGQHNRNEEFNTPLCTHKLYYTSVQQKFTLMLLFPLTSTKIRPINTIIQFYIQCIYIHMRYFFYLKRACLLTLNKPKENNQPHQSKNFIRGQQLGD